MSYPGRNLTWWIVLYFIVDFRELSRLTLFGMRQGTFTHYQPASSTLTKLLFLLEFLLRPRGVMDKAVGCGAEGPWFDPCQRQFFFRFR